LDTDTVSSRIATTPGTLALIPAKSVLSTQTRGYAEYVPPGYKDSADWPCIVYFHGDGELGDGTSATTLALLENSGLTAMVHQDNWDTRHRFVVLAPQFSSYDDRSGSNVNDFIEYAKSVYRIDTNRIYLTAVSGGGVALGNYLVGYSGGIAAAILPVSCYVPPIASSARWSEVPAWFLLGSADSTVQPSNVVENYTVLMGSSTLKATPKITLYTGVAHEGASFNLSYSPTTNNNRVETTFSGIELSPYSNIYDWLLKYHR
jgi:predicted peptidase